MTCPPEIPIASTFPNVAEHEEKQIVGRFEITFFLWLSTTPHLLIKWLMVLRSVTNFQDFATDLMTALILILSSQNMTPQFLMCPISTNILTVSVGLNMGKGWIFPYHTHTVKHHTPGGYYPYPTQNLCSILWNPQYLSYPQYINY